MFVSLDGALVSKDVIYYTLAGDLWSPVSCELGPPSIGLFSTVSVSSSLKQRMHTWPPILIQKKKKGELDSGHLPSLLRGPVLNAQTHFGCGWVSMGQEL